jgi:hypothetical protein
MRRNPLYIFKNLDAVGIYQVPLKSTVHILDADGNGTPKFLEIIAKDGLNAGSTIAHFLADPNLYIDLSALNEVYSELEKITEQGKQGWRILGRNPDDYGYIGEGAIDFSYNTSNSLVAGATGKFSFAEGYKTQANGGYGSHAEGYGSKAIGITTHAEGINTTALGYGSHAEGLDTQALGDYSHAEGVGTIAQNEASHSFGTYNIGTALDTLFEIGIGTDDLNRANAIEIYKSGLVVVPYLEEVEITNPRSLVTKEYVDNLGGELEKIEENGKIGWRLKGRNPDNYGDIGAFAVDFSTSQTTSTMNGAIEDYSAAFGLETIARNTGSFVVGQYNEGTAVNTVVEVGIGTETSGSISRKNALEIYVDGQIVAPELSSSLIASGDDQILITKEYLQSLEIEYNEINYDVTDVSQRQYTLSVQVTQSSCQKPIEVFNNGLKLRKDRDYTTDESNGVATVTLANNYSTNIGDWIYIKVPVIQPLDCN